jgi:thioredoxin-dependent peroxiredoxin
MVPLKVGDKAPDFSGINQDGNKISLSDFRGKKLILYFYPKDNTPGCTAEACNLNDNYNSWLERGFDVVGVSPDSVESHRKFREKYGLNSTLSPILIRKSFRLTVHGEKKACMAKNTWECSEHLCYR